MSEAEKLAVATAFAKEISGVSVAVKGIVSSHDENLSERGAGYVYAILTDDWNVVRGAASQPVSKEEIVDKLTGRWLSADGFINFPVKIVRAGAEAIADRIAAKGWGVSKVAA